MENCDWQPFIKAAIERNPVSIEATESMSLDAVYNWLEQMENDSIYDGKRLAQPDEVANYQTGDGLEKAFLLTAVAHRRNHEQDIKMTVAKDNVILEVQRKYEFTSNKGLAKQVNIPIVD